MYDLVFAYVDGDRDQPRFCAGLGLFLAGKFFFDYHGSLFWHMRAGMGDIVFALVECGILIKQEDDRKEDFRGVFDFEEAFELGYPWGAKP